MERGYKSDTTGGQPFNELYVALETKDEFRRLLDGFDRKYLLSVIGIEEALPTDRDAYNLFSYASYYENIGTQVLERGGEQYRQDVNQLLLLAATAFEKIANSFHDEVTRQLDGQIHPAVHAALCYTVCLNHQNSYAVLNSLFEQTKVQDLFSDGLDRSDSYDQFQMMIFLLLTRRFRQASDIAYALLNSTRDSQDDAILLIADAVTVLTGYMLRGRDSWERYFKALERAKKMDLDSLHLFIVQVMHSFGTQTMRYSIWSHLHLDEKYLRFLVSSRKNVLELWESQVEAINKGCFSDGNVVLSLPTSSGKTLLAEFKTIDYLTNVGKKVVYLVPTKALGQQVLRSIKPAIESIHKVAGLVMSITDKIDSDTFTKSDFVVMTPEKLEIMARNQPDALDNIGLVVVDEFHSISEDARGLKLDFLLYRLRKKENINFFMISAVIPNAIDVAHWIQGESISLDWRPTKIIPGFYIRGSNRLIISRIGEIELHTPKGVDDTIETAYWVERLGPVLVIDGTKDWVESKSKKFLALVKNDDRLSEGRLELSSQLSLLLGEMHPLTEMVKYGVAYHHADLEAEAKLLVESAMKKRVIRTLFATTTLAEGIDFPVKSVIVSTIFQSGNLMTRRLLNNIAGRAGRAGYYNEGYAIILCPERWKRKDAIRYWQSGNEPVYSVLSEVAKAIKNPQRFLHNEPKIAWYNRVLGVLESYLWALSNEGTINLDDESIDLLLRELFILEPSIDGPALEKLKTWAVEKRQYVEQLTLSPEIQKVLIGSGFSLKSSEIIYNAISEYANHAQSIQLDTNFIGWFTDLATTIEETKPKKKFRDIQHTEFLLKWITDGTADEGIINLVGKAKLSEYISSQVRFSFAWLAFTVGKVLEEIVGEKPCFPVQYFSDFVRYGTDNPAVAILCESGFDRISASKIALQYEQSTTGNKTTDTTEVWLWLAFQDIDSILQTVDAENYKVRRSIIDKIVDFDMFNNNSTEN
jgi:hypothetical protein